MVINLPTGFAIVIAALVLAFLDGIWWVWWRPPERQVAHHGNYLEVPSQHLLPAFEHQPALRNS